MLFLLAGFLFCFSLTWPGVLGMWISMEAANMILTASFFSFCGLTNRYVGLLGAVLVGGVSSCLLFLGFLNNSLLLCLFVAILLKIGMFPFMSWVVSVMINMPWATLYFFSSFSKIVVLYFADYFSCVDVGLVTVTYYATFLFLINYLVFGLSGFKFLIALGGVSSGSVGVLLVSRGGLQNAEIFLIFSLLYTALFIWVVQSVELGFVSVADTVFSCFSVLAVPFSVGIVYKIVGASVIVNYGGWFFCWWVVFSCLETIFVFVWLTEKTSVNEIW
nr:NADH dehydrogenase subunit 2 [Cichlidogyrus casuarinus]